SLLQTPGCSVSGRPGKHALSPRRRSRARPIRPRQQGTTGRSRRHPPPPRTAPHPRPAGGEKVFAVCSEAMSPEPQRDPPAADVVPDYRAGRPADARGSDLSTADVDGSDGEVAGTAPEQPRPLHSAPVNEDRNKVGGGGRQAILRRYRGNSSSRSSAETQGRICPRWRKYRVAKAPVAAGCDAPDSDCPGRRLWGQAEEGRKRDGSKRAAKSPAAASAEGGQVAARRAARRGPSTVPSDEDSDEYLEHAPLKPSKARRKRSAAAAARASGEDGGEDEDGSAKGRAKRTKKSRRKSATTPAPDVPFEQMTRSQQAEIIVGREFDEVLASINRQSRGRRAEKIDEAVGLLGIQIQWRRRPGGGEGEEGEEEEKKSRRGWAICNG
ncbi:MAG: hypothetical protein BJ554DRAFT_1285, partial [Olpidium bornovanus]